MSHPRRIEHVIVLLLENQSFDHLLGWAPGAGELTGDEFNYPDPDHAPADCRPEQGCIRVSPGAACAPPLDPPHDLLSVNRQIFGTREPGPHSRPGMQGFVAAAMESGNDLAASATVMQGYDPAQVPVLTQLAQEFCVCRRWFASVPGPTLPNRYFVHAATSDGLARNAFPVGPRTPTIFNHLQEQGHSWNVYFQLFPLSLAFTRLWLHPAHFQPYDKFTRAAAEGRLPNYTVLEPRYLNTPLGKANDFHPPSDVRYGEQLVAEVYNAVRQGPAWDRSLLVILFDEHGGLYDHVGPTAQVPAPGGKTSQDPPFDFRRLGVRVAALLISPYIPRGSVDDTTYEHASIPATLRRFFALLAPLTERDAAAATFERNLTLPAPRADAPWELHAPDVPSAAAPEPAVLSDWEQELVRLAGFVDSEPARAARSQARAGDMEALAALAETGGQPEAVSPAAAPVSPANLEEAWSYLEASAERFRQEKE